jgi:signal transduction histidine kinase
MTLNASDGKATRIGLSWRTIVFSALGWPSFGMLTGWHEYVNWPPRPGTSALHAIVVEPLCSYGPHALLWPLLMAVAQRVAAHPTRRVGAWLSSWAAYTFSYLLLEGTAQWLVAGAEQHMDLLPHLLDRLRFGWVFQGFVCGALTGVAAGFAHRRLASSAAQQAAQLREELLTAQLSVLRARLQPHFLFNALHAVSVVARHDGDKAERMLTCLGDLLRLSLQPRPQHLVPLRDELALLRPYLELQQIRFADRLHLTVSVPEALLTMAVPDLLLQPLVENALHHGIEARSGPGTVTISARAVDGRLHIAIEDDGVGVAGNPTEGIGLGTTRARLQGLFGDAAQLALRPRAGGGTVVEVSMPLTEAVNA